MPASKRQGVRRGTVGHHAPRSRCPQPEQVADRDVGARSRCPCRPARRSTSRSGTASCSSAAYVATPSTSHGWNGGTATQPALGRQPPGVLQRLLEVRAVHDHLGAVRLGGRVLVRRVALGDHDRDRDAVGAARRTPGSGCGCPGWPRPGRAPGRTSSSSRADEVQATAHLERAGGVVVLVLDPGLGAGEPLEQRPAQRRRRLHVRGHALAGPGQALAGEQRARAWGGPRHGGWVRAALGGPVPVERPPRWARCPGAARRPRRSGPAPGRCRRDRRRPRLGGRRGRGASPGGRWRPGSRAGSGGRRATARNIGSDTPIVRAISVGLEADVGAHRRGQVGERLAVQLGLLPASFRGVGVVIDHGEPSGTGWA